MYIFLNVCLAWDCQACDWREVSQPGPPAGKTHPVGAVGQISQSLSPANRRAAHWNLSRKIKGACSALLEQYTLNHKQTSLKTHTHSQATAETIVNIRDKIPQMSIFNSHILSRYGSRFALNEDKSRLRLSTLKSILECVWGQMENPTDSREGTEGIPKKEEARIERLQLAGTLKCSRCERFLQPLPVCYLHISSR